MNNFAENLRELSQSTHNAMRLCNEIAAQLKELRGADSEEYQGFCRCIGDPICNASENILAIIKPDLHQLN